MNRNPPTQLMSQRLKEFVQNEQGKPFVTESISIRLEKNFFAIRIFRML